MSSEAKDGLHGLAGRQHGWQVTADREGWLPRDKARELQAEVERLRGLLETTDSGEEFRATEWERLCREGWADRDRFRAQADELAEAIRQRLDHDIEQYGRYDKYLAEALARFRGGSDV